MAGISFGNILIGSVILAVILGVWFFTTNHQTKYLVAIVIAVGIGLMTLVLRLVTKSTPATINVIYPNSQQPPQPQPQPQQ